MMHSDPIIESKKLLLEIRKAIFEIERIGRDDIHSINRCLIFKKKMEFLEEELINLETIYSKKDENNLDSYYEGVLLKSEVILIDLKQLFSKLELVITSYYIQEKGLNRKY